ncbi:putative tetratricopeptide-like helical protein [Rosellinia necatrix]|uniref:Putative tetratricopeptide-like helical protein n=1 Tax=Rosellinia necatrix TaxID=77044 RepID=A0A1S7UHM7_ROSNE|nr:putative tetratricopeptide-like helical protein [Rosellinia necatrix]
MRSNPGRFQQPTQPALPGLTSSFVRPRLHSFVISRRALVTAAMGSQNDTTGLLSLPPEIRDQIYTLILHPDSNRTYGADEYTDYDYRGALALFQLNRQIYYEARDVFRRLNIFLRIETPWPEAEHHVGVVGHVPILASGARAARFRGHSLQVAIETPTAAGPEDGGTHQMVILADDLPAFTKAWFYWNLSHAGLNQWLSLKLFLRDPHAPDWDEKHVRREVQRRLLLPFGDVKGLRDFSVAGDPRPQPRIAAELRALQAQPPPPPERCLAECARLKDEGNELLRKGEARAALAVYNRAWEAIHIVVKGRQRHVHGEPFFARELVGEPFAGKNGQLERMNLRLQLVANTCLAYLRLADWPELQFWGMRTIRLMRQATGANDAPIPPEDEALLGFPSAAQVGKIYFRTARAFEELGDRAEARRLLRVAQVYLPHDQTVRKTLASLALKLG